MSLGLDLYFTDPPQDMLTAGEDLDYKLSRWRYVRCVDSDGEVMSDNSNTALRALEIPDVPPGQNI